MCSVGQAACVAVCRSLVEEFTVPFGCTCDPPFWYLSRGTHDWCIWQTFATCRYSPRRGNGALVKYWPLTRFQPTAGKGDTSQSLSKCLFTYEVETLPCSHDSFIHDKQISDLCVDFWYNSVRRVRVVRPRTHWPGRHFQVCCSTNVCQNPVAETVWELFTWLLPECALRDALVVSRDFK